MPDMGGMGGMGPRSGDDLLFLYTGGTTGMPKGVMWSHQIWRSAGIEGAEAAGLPVPKNMDEQVMAAQALGRHVRNVPACPLMHGTGLFTAMGSMIGRWHHRDPDGKQAFRPGEPFRNGRA
jgi:acyl-CoA synthetase (AMP-forming)/AMP-acid ligase II